MRQHGTGNHAHRAVHFLRGLDAIPGLCQKYRAVGQDQVHAIATRKSRQITDIRPKPDDEGIELLLSHLPRKRRAAQGELAKGHEPVPEPATARDPPTRWLAAYGPSPMPHVRDSRNRESSQRTRFPHRYAP